MRRRVLPFSSRYRGRVVLRRMDGCAGGLAVKPFARADRGERASTTREDASIASIARDVRTITTKRIDRFVRRVHRVDGREVAHGEDDDGGGDG